MLSTLVPLDSNNLDQPGLKLLPKTYFSSLDYSRISGPSDELLSKYICCVSLTSEPLWLGYQNSSTVSLPVVRGDEGIASAGAKPVFFIHYS